MQRRSLYSNSDEPAATGQPSNVKGFSEIHDISLSRTGPQVSSFSRWWLRKKSASSIQYAPEKDSASPRFALGKLFMAPVWTLDLVYGRQPTFRPLFYSGSVHRQTSFQQPVAFQVL